MKKHPQLLLQILNFQSGGDVLNDSTIAAAILDRLLHHCTIINIDGPSYRTKNIFN